MEKYRRNVKRKQSLALALLISLLPACRPGSEQSSEDQPSAQPAQEQASIDPNDAPASAVLEAPGWKVLTTGLNSRVQLSKAKVDLVQGDRPAPMARVLGLQRVAVIRPATLKGVTLTPTDVHIDGHLAYISYCRVGDAYGGAVQILDFSRPEQPRMLAELTQAGNDFYALAGSRDRLYLTGSSANQDLSSPAVVQGIRLSPDGKGLRESLGLVELPSFAGIDIAADDKQVYALSGDKNGALTRLDAENMQPRSMYMVNGRRVRLATQGNHETAVLVFRPGEMRLLSSDLTLLHSRDLSGSSATGTDDPVLALGDGTAVLRSQLEEAIYFDLDALEVKSRVKARPALASRRLKAKGAGGEAPVSFVNQGRRGVSVAQIHADQIETLGTLKGSSSSSLVQQQGCTVFMIDSKGTLSLLTHKLCQRSEPDALKVVDDGALGQG